MFLRSSMRFIGFFIHQISLMSWIELISNSYFGIVEDDRVGFFRILLKTTKKKDKTDKIKKNKTGKSNKNNLVIQSRDFLENLLYDKVKFLFWYSTGSLYNDNELEKTKQKSWYSVLSIVSHVVLAIEVKFNWIKRKKLKEDEKVRKLFKEMWGIKWVKKQVRMKEKGIWWYCFCEMLLKEVKIVIFG